MSDYPEDELARRRAQSAPATRIPSRQEYDMNEYRRYEADLREIDHAPLADRKAACNELYEAMRDTPALVAERVGWLLDGNYGKGAYDMAWRVMAQGPRANKVASLTQMTGAMEWRCPARMVVQAWKKLTPGEKTALDHAVRAALKSAQEERDRG